MAPKGLPESLLAFSFFILQISNALAQSTATTPSDPTSTSQAPQSADTGNGDGGGVPPGAAEPTSEAGQNAAGAAGGQGGSLNLSSGSTIAIAVVVSVVVILAIASTVLWYIAKKRQWAIRDTIRYSIRKVGSAIASPLSPRTPRTPSKMTFPPPNKSSTTTNKISPSSTSSKPPRLRDPVPNSLKGRMGNQSIDMTERNRDLEKGAVRPAVTRLQIPQSSFDMDSPASGKVSKWSKVFGRK